MNQVPPQQFAERDPLTERVIGLAIEVHRALGPGLLESAYEECLCFELDQHAVPFARQVSLPIVYKAVRLDCGYRIDLIIERRLIIELKTVERLMPVHEAQLLTYLKLSGIRAGLLLNLNAPVLKDGIKRMML
jgi:GxxExxY protein